MQLEAKREIMIIEFGLRSRPLSQNFHFENELGQRLRLLFQEPVNMDRFQLMRMLCNWPILFVNFDQARVLHVSFAIIFD